MADVNDLEIYEDAPTPDSKIERERIDQIEGVPMAPEELAERLDENHAASPADSGGDIDAEWEEVNTSGSEAVFGHNPTPDQSDVELNAHAMGINFEDKQPLDFVKNLAKRDEDRFELDEASKSSDDSI
jgi:hypothetical protein